MTEGLEHILPYFMLHSTQLVLVKNGLGGNNKGHYQIKLIPFEQNSFSKTTKFMCKQTRDKKLNAKKDIEDENVFDDVLDSFIFD